MKLVIFDMDGVLVDACEWHRSALNHALKDLCNYEISLEDHYREFNGLPTKIKLKKLASRGILSEDMIPAIENLKQEKTFECIEAQAQLRPEKVQLMEFLKSKGVKIGCYTNSIRATAELMLDKTGILRYFDFIITNQDVQRSKPDPEGYNLCMSLALVEKSETLIVEDSPTGIQAAVSSGAVLAQVLNPDEVNIENLGKYFR